MNSNQNYYQTEIYGINLNSEIKESNFEQVKFEKCNFQELSILGCSFIDCIFSNSNLSLITSAKSSFLNCNFINCKIIGVNWHKIQGALGVSLSFENSILNYSYFNGISFVKSKIYKCEVIESDFASANLKKCDCRESNFLNTNFSNANLEQADFRGANNYFIDIFENKKNFKGAKFSRIEVENLLAPLQIDIE